MGAEVAAIATIGSALMGAAAADSAGKAARQAAEVDAKRAEKNAELAIEEAKDQRARFETQFRMAEGANMASLGTSGITTEGSASDVLAANAANAERDAAAITHQGELRRQAFLDDASSLRAGGRAQERAGQMGAAASLLSGAGTLYDRFGGK